METRGGDWAHWTHGFQNVIRAYAFANEDSGYGVGVFWEGEIPEGVRDALMQQVLESTDWHLAEHG
jgi:hypothetical protein